MSQFSKEHFYDVDVKVLIHKYKQYECLWNYNSPSYKNKSLKQKAWNEISRYFQKDVDEVKRKIKYMRSAYVSEKKKVDVSRKTGEPPYRPSLYYYKELDFLSEIVVSRKQGSCKIEFDNSNLSANTEDNDELEDYSNEENCDLQEQEFDCKVENFAESEPELRHSPQTPISQSPKIVSSRSLVSRPVKRNFKGNVKLNKSVPTTASFSLNRKAPNNSLYTSFGKTIALQLQQLPLAVAVLTMSEIQTILTKKTLEHLRSLKRRDLSFSHLEFEDSYNDTMEETYDSS